MRPRTPSAEDDEELDQEEREPLPEPRLLTFGPVVGETLDATPLWHHVPGGGFDFSESLATRFTAWSAGEADLEDPPEVCRCPAVSLLSHVNIRPNVVLMRAV